MVKKFIPKGAPDADIQAEGAKKAPEKAGDSAEIKAIRAAARTARKELLENPEMDSALEYIGGDICKPSKSDILIAQFDYFRDFSRLPEMLASPHLLKAVVNYYAEFNIPYETNLSGPWLAENHVPKAMLGKQFFPDELAQCDDFMRVLVKKHPLYLAVASPSLRSDKNLVMEVLKICSSVYDVGFLWESMPTAIKTDKDIALKIIDICVNEGGSSSFEEVEIFLHSEVIEKLTKEEPASADWSGEWDYQLKNALAEHTSLFQEAVTRTPKLGEALRKYAAKLLKEEQYDVGFDAYPFLKG